MSSRTCKEFARRGTKSRMGTGEKYLGMGVVAVTLGLAACGGRYAVGSGDPDAGPDNAGAGNTGDDDSGGSSASGGTDGGVTAGAASGGRGGTTDAGSFGGVAGVSVGGSSTGGSSGTTSCYADEGSFPAWERATPEVIWDRLCEFINGEPRTPLLPLPETATNDWIREAVRALIDERALDELAHPPLGLSLFMQEWAFGGGDETGFSQWWVSKLTAPGGTFAALFDPAHPLDPVDRRVSFLSDSPFLEAHPNSTRRGIWMMENFTCVEPVRPPPEIDIEEVTVPPNMTRRQAIEEVVSQAVCAGCHAMWDPLGFSLENYDELGEYRTTENGLPIDASGTYDQGFSSTFESIVDLAPDIASSCAASQCFAKRLFDYAMAQARPDIEFSSQGTELSYVQNRFTERNGEFVYLLEAIATTPAFTSK